METTLVNWFQEIMGRIYRLRGFQQNETTKELFKDIFQIIKNDPKFNRTKAELWLQYGLFPHSRKQVILQDFYPTEKQILEVTQGRDLVVMTPQELQQLKSNLINQMRQKMEQREFQIRSEYQKEESNSVVTNLGLQIVELQSKLYQCEEQLRKKDKKNEQLEQELSSLKEKYQFEKEMKELYQKNSESEKEFL